MHQQAILVQGKAVLGSPGDLVTIDDIEKHYSTTNIANAGNVYKCADSNCGVPVIAVITKLTKQKRKNSPASYFRASSKNPHVKGCSRVALAPEPIISPGINSVTGQASPNRTSIPTVWTDPVSVSVVTTGGSVSATGTPSRGSSGTRSKTGTGTSQRHSQMVESFAKEWLGMNAQGQRAAHFAAPWNPEGTYYSAFHPIAYRKTVDVLTVGQKIYVGVIQKISNGTNAIVITLVECNASGEALNIVVGDATFTLGSAGKALGLQLGSLASSTNPNRVFILGTFARNLPDTLSLTIQHPHYIYID